MTQKHTWKNSQGKEFELSIVPPFFENAIIKEIEVNFPLPQVPYFAVDITLPNGKTKTEYYPHSDETMTEEVFADNAPDIIFGWTSENGKPLRWQDATTVSEQRAWRGYKKKLMQYYIDFNRETEEKVFRGVLCAGIKLDITDEWRANYKFRYGGLPVDERFAFLLDQVCVIESDFGDLAIAINEIRQISKEKVDALVGRFREAKERNASSETA